MVTEGGHLVLIPVGTESSDRHRSSRKKRLRPFCSCELLRVSHLPHASSAGHPPSPVPEASIPPTLLQAWDTSRTSLSNSTFSSWAPSSDEVS